jgi:hypothetical protein
MKNKRVNLRKILDNPVNRRKLMVDCIIAVQAREGIVTTREQAETAYDKVQKELPAIRQRMNKFFANPLTIDASFWYTLNMSQSRKTFDVAELLWTVNFRLEHSKPEDVFERQAIASLLEGVLFKTNNYKGFSFLGMIFNPEATAPIIPDDSRRCYFIHSNLMAEYKVVEQRKKEEGF